MIDFFRYRNLVNKFEKAEKLIRPDIYNFLNRHLRDLMQRKARKNAQLLAALEKAGIKWYKFRGLEEIEAIPVSKTLFAEQGHDPLMHRKSVMAASLHRILSWYRCGDKKVIWITPNKNRIKQSGFTRSSRIISFPQDWSEIIRKLNKYDNYVLAARPAILAQLAFFIRYNKIEAPKPDLIIAFNHDITVGADNLLKETFSVPIVRLITDTHYSSLIATCRYDYYHLFEPISCHEIVNSRGIAVTNGRGTLVATPLHTNKPSLLRYDTGIEVIPNQNAVCPCGLSYRTIDNLSYVSRPSLKGLNNVDLLIPLPEELHTNIVGVNYEQNYPGEVLITIKEHEIGKSSPNNYKEWFHQYWKHEIRIILIVDNRTSFLGDSSLSNFQIKTTSQTE
jgi:hypothetical protein